MTCVSLGVPWTNYLQAVTESLKEMSEQTTSKLIKTCYMVENQSPLSFHLYLSSNRGGHKHNEVNILNSGIEEKYLSPIPAETLV